MQLRTQSASYSTTLLTTSHNSIEEQKLRRRSLAERSSAIAGGAETLLLDLAKYSTRHIQNCKVLCSRYEADTSKSCQVFRSVPFLYVKFPITPKTAQWLVVNDHARLPSQYPVSPRQPSDCCWPFVVWKRVPAVENFPRWTQSGCFPSICAVR